MASTTEIREPQVSDQVVAEVAQTIGELHRAAGLCFAAEVGKLVLDRFFHGDMELFRSHGKKSVSLRKLAAHPAMPLSKSSLFQAVAIYGLLDRLGGVHTCGHLCASHFRAVLPLPPANQKRLLETAKKKRWSVRALEAEVRKVPRPAAPGGRPELPAFVKTIRSLRKYRDAPDVHFGGMNGGNGMSRQQARELYEIVSAVRAQLERVQRELHELGRGLDVE